MASVSLLTPAAGGCSGGASAAAVCSRGRPRRFCSAVERIQKPTCGRSHTGLHCHCVSSSSNNSNIITPSIAPARQGALRGCSDAKSSMSFRSKLHTMVNDTCSHWNSSMMIMSGMVATHKKVVRAVNTDTHSSSIFPDSESSERDSECDSDADKTKSPSARALSRVRRSHARKAGGYEHALSLWRLGGHFREQAALAFESFLREEPSHSLAWVSYSRLIMDLKGNREARRVLFRGLQSAGDVGVLLQALGLAELLDGRYLHGVVLLEESVRYPPQFLDNADKESIMADRFRRARVLRWKTVQAARMRAVHSIGPSECTLRFRQVRTACRRRVAARSLSSRHGTDHRSQHGSTNHHHE